MKVPFFRLQADKADISAVTSVLKDGWLTTGARAAELEELVKARCGAKHAVAVSSASVGLQVALAALDIGPGDEVITTAFTFTATCAAILHCGATPVLADIDPQTLNIAPQSISEKITPKTKALITVDIAGIPCDYRSINALCRKHKLKLICDAAHSLGASYRSKPVGSFGDITVFSFYSTKNITTGEGGMILTQKKRLADRIRRLSLHGITKSALQRNKAADWRYDIREIGCKANLSDLNAALGVARLKRFDSLLESRSRVAAQYASGLAGFRDFLELPLVPAGCEHAWHLFIIQLKLDRWRIGRDRFIKELTRLGIGCGVHYIPLYHFSGYRDILNGKPDELYQTEQAFKRVVSLPLYPELSASEVKAVCGAIGELVNRFGK